MEEEASESSSSSVSSTSNAIGGEERFTGKKRKEREGDDVEGEGALMLDEDGSSSGAVGDEEYSIQDVLLPVGKQRGRPPTPPIPLQAKRPSDEDEDDADDDIGSKSSFGKRTTSSPTSIINGLHEDGEEEEQQEEEEEEEHKALMAALKASSIQAANERLRALQQRVNQDIITKRKEEEEQEVNDGKSSSAGASTKKQRERAILRGLDFLYQLACDERNFVSFGADVIMCLFDLATQAAEPCIRQSALERAEILGFRWKEKFPTLQSIAQLKKEAMPLEEEEEEGKEMDVDEEEEEEDEGEGKQKKRRKRIKLEGDDEEEEDEEEDQAKPDKDDINTAIRGAHLLIRMGLSARSLVQEVQAYLKEEGFKAKDFVNFDPRRRPVTLPRERPAHRLAEAIDAMFYSQRVGVDLGGTLEDVLPLLKLMRPYKTCEEIGWDEWEDQFLLVNNAINVCSCAGELRLQPTLFPQEYAMLCHPDTFKWPMEVSDCQLVGDICHCLAIFGHHTSISTPSSTSAAAPPTPPSSTDDDEEEPSSSSSSGGRRGGCLSSLVQARAFLLQKQCKDGSWPLRDGSLEPYDMFLACHAATAGLLDLQPKGYGPATVQIADLLRTINSPEGTSSSGGNKRLPPSVTCCGDRRPLVLKKFDGLAELYRCSAGVSLDLTLKKGMEDEHDPADPEPADFRIGGVSLRQLSDLETLRGRAGKLLTEMVYWKEKGPGRLRKDLRSSSSSSPIISSSSGEGGVMSKAQLVSKKIAASKGLDLNGFKNAFQIYARETAGGNGSSAVGAAMSVTLGTAKVDLYELFQALGRKGGAGQIGGMEGWQAIAKEINLPTSMMDRARRLKDLYEKTLLGFEDYWLEEFEAQGQRAQMMRYIKEKTALMMTTTTNDEMGGGVKKEEGEEQAGMEVEDEGGDDDMSGGKW